jgi:hypothetical protein
MARRFGFRTLVGSSLQSSLMSFDLAVYHTAEPPKQERAAAIYLGLCEDWPYLEGNSSAVTAFYEELTNRWPEIDRVAKHCIVAFDHCLWSFEFSHSGMAVVMTSVWSKAEEVALLVKPLAGKHGLLLFGPNPIALFLQRGSGLNAAPCIPLYFAAALNVLRPFPRLALHPPRPQQKTQQFPPRFPEKTQYTSSRQRFGPYAGECLHTPAQILAAPRPQPVAARCIPDESDRRKQTLSLSSE